MLLDSFTPPLLPAAFKYLLDDGTPALVRPIRAGDAPRLRAAFRQWATPAVRRRIAGPLESFDDADIDRWLIPDEKDCVAWGALDLTRPEETGIGAAYCRLLPDDPSAARISIVVAEAYRRQGAGQVLHACMHLAARLLGVNRLHYDVQDDNPRLIRLLHALGAQHDGRADAAEQFSLPVYYRAWDVPGRNPLGVRFADTFRRLHKAEVVSPAAAASAPPA